MSSDLDSRMMVVVEGRRKGDSVAGIHAGMCSVSLHTLVQEAVEEEE